MDSSDEKNSNKRLLSAVKLRYQRPPAEFEQVIAAVSPKRVKTEEIAADAEFTKRFYDNEFKQAIAYGSKEMLRLAGG
ncbi:hypothetical protein L0F63_005766 [Massospora cicadina]|nr:hypothetical protein L0F63_005766 [Massospora cicadina]